MLGRQALAVGDLASEDDVVEYDLRSLTAPRLSGLFFKAFVTLLEARVLGSILRHRLLVQNGFEAFRNAFPVESLGGALQVKLPLHPPPAASDSLAAVTPADCTEAERKQFIAQLDAFLLESHDRSTQWGPGSGSDGLPTRFDSIRVLHDGYLSRKFTPLEVAKSLLRRIKMSNEGDEPLNAIIGVDEKTLLRDAEASAARWDTGTPLSCIDGVPIAVKSQLKVAGLPCTAGIGYNMMPMRPNETEDGGVARALRSVGALVSISAAMDEMGGGVRGFNPHSGQVRNTLNKDVNPGGSSSGCASAVAAGLVPCAIGTDGGGSCRIPAAACGILGLKPTFARIGVHGRCQEADSGVPATLHIGPLAACAVDLTYLYHLVALLCPHKSICSRPEWEVSSLQLNVPEAPSPPRPQGVRVGIYTPWLEDADASWVQATRDILEFLVEQGGVIVKEIPIRNLEHCRIAHGISILGSMRSGLDRDRVFEEGSEKKLLLGLDARAKMCIAGEFTEADARRSELVRAKCLKQVDRIFGECDFLITPAVGEDPIAVPANTDTGVLDVRADSAAMKYMLFANLTGIPAAVIPVGKKKDSGIYHSVHVMGKPWGETRLLDFLRWMEEAAPRQEGI